MRAARAEGHISSKAPRVHFAKDMDSCPHQIPAYKAYLVPGDRFIITKRRDALICAIYFLYQGKRQNRLAACRPRGIRDGGTNRFDRLGWEIVLERALP